MLFGHQHNDASQPEPAATAPAPSLNPLAVDPSTGVSLPVPTEVEPTATPQSTVVQPSTDSPLNPGPATPPPPPPVPTSAPTVDAPAEETPPAQTAAPEPTSTPTPDTATETAPTPQPSTTEEPTMPFDDATQHSSGFRADSIHSSIDEDDSNAVLADFMAGDGPDSPEGQGPIPFAHTKPGMRMKESSASTPPAAEDLLTLKQVALAQLAPLVDKLDQTPEEHFRTKMMMLQSTDNQSLLIDAYDAAQQITDEKARAQALLDVINEINYFNSLNTNQQNN